MAGSVKRYGGLEGARKSAERRAPHRLLPANDNERPPRKWTLTGLLKLTLLLAVSALLVKAVVSVF